MRRKLLDFLCIAGYHSDERVSSDSPFYAPVVRPQGLVPRHDIQPIRLRYEHTASVQRFSQALSAYEPECRQSITRSFGIGACRR